MTSLFALRLLPRFHYLILKYMKYPSIIMEEHTMKEKIVANDGLKAIWHC